MARFLLFVLYFCYVFVFWSKCPQIKTHARVQGCDNKSTRLCGRWRLKVCTKARTISHYIDATAEIKCVFILLFCCYFFVSLQSNQTQQDPQLLKVINLTAIAIRRLIKMSKKISAFKNMCQEDQLALLKGGCTEMMILRSAMQYDCDRATWKVIIRLGASIGRNSL